MRISLVSLLVLTSFASASFGQGLTIEVRTEGVPQSWLNSPYGTSDPETGVYTYSGSWTNAAGLWQCNWNITAKADPWVSANITFLNTTANPQIYTVTVTQPIAPPITPSSLIGGSMGGSVTDANFDGLGGVSTALGTPLYLAFLDAAAVLPIYPDPTSFANPFGWPGQTVNIPAVNVGLPGPTIPAGPVFTSISIQHRFQLSPGDSMGITSFFVVVPEPATLALLASGAIVLLRRRGEK